MSNIIKQLPEINQELFDTLLCDLIQGQDVSLEDLSDEIHCSKINGVR